ncbi:MAG: hypothetical protein KC731_29155, partial [Myxococcales bacterium]|nr:hypothetical protein [Myxococcales bacterium]
MRNIGAIATLTLTLGLALAACGGADTESGVQDATSMPYADGTPEAAAILAVANDKSLDLVAFDEEVGLHKTAAKNLIAYRDGDPETDADDHRFAELRDLWSISYCKTSCFESLLAYAKDHGLYGGNGNISVVFSPQQNPDEQHLAKIAKLIDDEADETIDIALYSYSHSGPIRDAIERALDRGVKIRFLADTDLANSASKGGALEEIGIDVRRVTKIMHHKFAIIDGPRDDDSLDRAMSAHVVSGSANWSSSAGSLYDENTLFMTGYPEIALRLQRDFDTLWAGSKDKVWQSFEWDQTRGNITDALIAQYDDPNTDVFLTSFNFKPTSSGGWSVLGTSVVTDELVKAIHTAETSIHVASGHFINLPVAQAILDVKTQRPDVEVDIILDCQEIPRDGEIVALKAAIEAAGGTIQYKCNTFRWHYKYAMEMHFFFNDT